MKFRLTWKFQPRPWTLVDWICALCGLSLGHSISEIVKAFQ